MRDVQMVYGKRLWLAVRESTLAKRARWRGEGVVTSAMCPACFLFALSTGACGGVRSEYACESECSVLMLGGGVFRVSRSKLREKSRVTAFELAAWRGQG